MRSPKFSVRLVSVIMAMVLIVTGTCITCFTAGASSYQSQISELEQKKTQIKSKISSLQKDIKKQAALRDALQEEIDVVQRQIDIYNNQISQLQRKINKMEAEQKAKEAEIEQKKKTFLARIRAMYMAGSDSDLTILLGADDFADYLYQNELLASVTEYDNKVMDKLRDDVAEIEKIKKNVETEKANIKSVKSTVDAKRNELSATMKTYNSVISKLQGQQSELKGDLATYDKQIKALEAKIKAAATRPVPQNITYSGSQFIWPVPGYYLVTSGFKWRWGRQHKGIDIAGSNIYGSRIVAAADGVVSLVDYNGGGYGYYVMVNHGNYKGNSYVTLYGHMSRQAAYVGQKVKAGDTIGYVGSTGFSTGPHCHFEIRVNGTAQNPMNFFSSVK